MSKNKATSQLEEVKDHIWKFLIKVAKWYIFPSIREHWKVDTIPYLYVNIFYFLLFYHTIIIGKF